MAILVNGSRSVSLVAFLALATSSQTAAASGRTVVHNGVKVQVKRGPNGRAG